MFRVYVASSWRNESQPEVVKLCRELGLKTYDFKNPEGGTGFGWSQTADDTEISKDWKNWTFEEYQKALHHPLAVAGYDSDMTALIEADICILVFPAGVSAAMEFGYAVGAGKQCCVIGMPREADLMVKMAGYYARDLDDLKEWLMWVVEEMEKEDV